MGFCKKISNNIYEEVFFMALIKCGECGGNVSTSADQCPHCGYSSDSTCWNCEFYVTDGEYDWCKKRHGEDGLWLTISSSNHSCLGFRQVRRYD